MKARIRQGECDGITLYSIRQGPYYFLAWLCTWPEDTTVRLAEFSNKLGVVRYYNSSDINNEVPVFYKDLLSMEPWAAAKKALR